MSLSFDAALAAAQSRGYYLSNLMDFHPKVPRYRVVLRKWRDSGPCLGMGWGHSPAEALVEAEKAYGKELAAYDAAPKPITLKDLGIL